jgi:hypothetical protein
LFVKGILMAPKDEKEVQRRQVPEPVRMAQEALRILAAEGVLIDKDLKKRLPGYAMQQAKSGKEVTVEGLVERARQGNLAVSAQSKRQQRQKTYEEIAASFRNPQGKSKTSDDARNEEAVFQAIGAGDLHMLKQLPTKGVAPHKILDHAAKTGHFLHTVKYFAEELYDNPDVDTLKWLLRSSAVHGHVDAVKYFVEERGMDPRADNEDILITALINGRLDLVKYLVGEKGADIHVNNDVALSVLAVRGHLDLVKYLVEDLGIEPCDEDGYCRALGDAATTGHLDVVKYFVEERNINAAAVWFYSLRQTIEGGVLDAAKYLAEHGANLTVLSKQEMTDLEDYPDIQEARWQKTAHTLPPHIRLYKEDPLYYRPEAYDAVHAILQQEMGYDKVWDTHLAGYAFYASGLFGTEDRVLRYLEKWWPPHSAQPLHDVLYGIKLPQRKTPEMDLKSWADAVLKCGPSMAKLVKFADKLPVPEKSDDGRTWSMVKTRNRIAQFAYERANENLELAALCIENAVEEHAFDKALDLSKEAPENKNIPDVSIEGEAFDMPGAAFRRLDKDDARGLFLGELVDCCQSIGSVGAECAEHGFTSENGGFYVVENAKGKIVGQTWAWRGDRGELVLDSLETLGHSVTEQQWKKLLDAFGEALAKKPGDIKALHVGMGGATPRGLKEEFNAVAIPAVPADYNGYRDSHEQISILYRGDLRLSKPRPR